MPRTPRDNERWQARRRSWRSATFRDVAPTLALILAALVVLALVVYTVAQS